MRIPMFTCILILPDNAAALLAVLPPPGPSVELDPTRLLDTLTGVESPHLEPVHP